MITTFRMKHETRTFPFFVQIENGEVQLPVKIPNIYFTFRMNLNHDWIQNFIFFLLILIWSLKFLFCFE